jgi:hypothetical protein
MKVVELSWCRQSENVSSASLLPRSAGTGWRLSSDSQITKSRCYRVDHPDVSRHKLPQASARLRENRTEETHWRAHGLGSRETRA